MRECEQTSAVNMETARKSRKQDGGSSLRIRAGALLFTALTALRSLPAREGKSNCK